MSVPEITRILMLCLALASVETLHGIARAALLVPRIGKARALRISIFTGSLLAFGVCFLFVPGIGLAGALRHLYLGMGLAAFMAGFDIVIGRVVLRLPWRRILRDFNPAGGNYLTFGLLALVFMPLLVWWLTRGSG